MKRRTSFVTNSSSSSFVCEVCGASEGGYDVCASDVGFTQCEAGHEFCEGHKLSLEVTKEQLRDELQELISDRLAYFKKNNSRWAKRQAERHQETLSRVDQMDSDELSEEYLALYDELPAACCPICSLDTVRDADILMYIQKKTGVKTTEVAHEIQQQFGTLDELKKYLKED